MFIYFSKILSEEVLDKSGAFVGRVYDIIAEPTEVYPKSSLLIAKRGFFRPLFATIPWSDIDSIEPDLRLKIGIEKIVFSKLVNNKEELGLRRDILDQQVVDTYNHNVIRVNDIHLIKVGLEVMIAHVDIGTRGIVRRLGFEHTVDKIVKFFSRSSRYLNEDKLISWKYIQPLSINPVSKTIKVNVPQNQLSSIPSADLAEVLLDLDSKQRLALFSSLELSTKARLFSKLEFAVQKSLVDELPIKDASQILEKMPADETADFLGELPDVSSDALLSHMESKASKKLSQLLGYSSTSAGGMMTTEYLALAQTTTVEQALKEIKEKTAKVETIQYVYIIDEKHHFIGSTNLRRLISADPKDPITKAAFVKPIYVHLKDGVKKVAFMMDKYKCYALPVIDDSRTIQGIITIDDILSHVISIAWRKTKSMALP